MPVEIATLTRENGETRIVVLDNSVVDGLIKVHEAEEAQNEAEKKKKDKS